MRFPSPTTLLSAGVSRTTPPGTVFVPVALVAVGAISGAAIVVWSPGSLAGMPLLLLAGAVALTIGLLSPLWFLSSLLAAWAPTLFLTSDFELGRLLGFDLTLSRVFGVGVLAVYSIRLAIHLAFARPRERLSNPLKLYLAFVALMVVALLRSPQGPEASADFTRFLTGSLILLAIAVLPMSASEFRVLHLGLVAGVLLAAAITVGFAVSGTDFGVWVTFGVERMGGTMAGPGATSSLMVNGMAALLPFVILTSARRRLGAVLGLLLALIAILLTVTRSAILAVPLLIAITAWLLPYPRVNRRIVLACLAGVAIVYAIAIATADDAVVESRIRDIPVIGGADLSDSGTGTGRIGLWRAHFGAFVDAPLLTKVFGRGLHTSFDISERMLGYHVPSYVNVQGPHNTYLWLLDELGLLGFGVYVAFLVSSFRFLVRFARNEPKRRAASVFVACSAAFLVTYQLSSEMFGWNIPTFAGRVYFLALLGLSYRLVRQPELFAGAHPYRANSGA